MAYKKDAQVVVLAQMELPEEDVRKKLEPGGFKNQTQPGVVNV